MRLAMMAGRHSEIILKIDILVLGSGIMLWLLIGYRLAWTRAGGGDMGGDNGEVGLGKVTETVWVARSMTSCCS